MGTEEKLENEGMETVNNTGNANPETNEPAKTEQDETKLTVEQLMAELSRERAEKAKLKNSLNDAAADAAKYKRQLREKMTAEEQIAEEKKKEAEEYAKYVKGLELFQRTTLAKDRYTVQGMPIDLATKAAQAEVDGDFDTLSQIQGKFSQSKIEAAKNEWIRTRPDMNIGNADEEEDPFLKGFNSVPYRFG